VHRDRAISALVRLTQPGSPRVLSQLRVIVDLDEDTDAAITQCYSRLRR
jgi:hypothetical protein